MSKQLKKNILILFFIFSANIYAQEQDESIEISAYYTKLTTGQDWEKYDRTGQFSDIVVDFGDGNGKFVFWRGSSYLPYWENSNGERFYVNEVISRSGDGDQVMPDRVNTYSHVRIIESNPDKVVVHWRYLPEFGGLNPHSGVSSSNFVDEYFYISSNKTLLRTVKKGTEKIDDWNSDVSLSEFKLSLSSNGIEESILKYVDYSKNKEVEKPLNKAKNISEPITSNWFKFDESNGDYTNEFYSDHILEIEGDKTVWKKGVSGKSLQFDGYKTAVKVPALIAPKPTTEITLEGWIAIGAYPWNWCPIIQQADDVPETVRLYRGKYDITEIDKREGDLSVGLVGGDPENQEGGVDVEQEIDFDEIEFTVKYEKELDIGYFLGVNGNGNPGFKLNIGGVWQELTSDYFLERKKWYHIVATYSKASGKMKIYVNGRKTDEKNVGFGDIVLSKKDIQIGKGKPRRPINPVRENTFPASYSFDGLIDEVKVYDRSLSKNEIKQSYSSLEHISFVDLDKRDLPTGENRKSFGAYYTNLDFYDNWDNLWRFSNHSDIVVEFEDNPTKFIFWKGVSYIPMMVNENNFWYSNEFNETWSTSGGEGCQEPMSDKQVYYNHVRIIENTPARVVVHYRFPLVDVNKYKANFDSDTGWYDVADWYYFIYPDGVAAKAEQLWTSGDRIHEWQESMAIFGPDQHPHNLIERDSTFTMVRVSDGAYKTYDWNPLPPDGIDLPERANIHHVNYKGDYDPVTITDDIIWSNVYGGEITDYAIFPTWNHWPVAQMPSDGRYASFPDRTSHSSLSHIYWEDYDEQYGSRPYQTKILLEGMLNKSPIELIPLAKSWLTPPMLKGVKGCTGAYNKLQRAYVFDKEDDEVSLTILATDENPLENACLIFNNWDSDSEPNISIDGKPTDAKWGITKHTDGKNKLLVWIEKSSTTPMHFELSSR